MLDSDKKKFMVITLNFIL